MNKYLIIMGKIRLEGMEFFAHHGHHSDEITSGNKFVVDLYFDADTSVAADTDELENTLNYEMIYEFIKKEMAIRSNLLEHIAQRIMNGLKEKFPAIKNAELTLSKYNPPLKGIVQKVGITING